MRFAVVRARQTSSIFIKFDIGVQRQEPKDIGLARKQGGSARPFSIKKSL
jgi:hypothetical protein